MARSFLHLPLSDYLFWGANSHNSSNHSSQVWRLLCSFLAKGNNRPSCVIPISHGVGQLERGLELKNTQLEWFSSSNQGMEGRFTLSTFYSKTVSHSTSNTTTTHLGKCNKQPPKWETSSGSSSRSFPPAQCLWLLFHEQALLCITSLPAQIHLSSPSTVINPLTWLSCVMLFKHMVGQSHSGCKLC